AGLQTAALAVGFQASLGGARLIALLPVVAPLCGLAAFAVGERVLGRSGSPPRAAVTAIAGAVLSGAAGVLLGALALDFVGAFAGLALCVPGAVAGAHAGRASSS